MMIHDLTFNSNNILTNLNNINKTIFPQFQIDGIIPYKLIEDKVSLCKISIKPETEINKLNNLINSNNSENNENLKP